MTFILGGASSGKSNYAETLVKMCDMPRIYLATAQPFDAEMQAKITAHRAARAGDGWTTIEAPMDPLAAIGTTPKGHVVLLDCLTLWLSNAMLAGRDVDGEMAALMEGLRQHPGPLVVVSNEVGQGIVPETALGRQFRSAQGRLNQNVAGAADLVVNVIAGLPLTLKGDAP